MKVLLVRPPSHFTDNKPKYDLPVGLLSIAACLLEDGHDVQFLDATMRDTEQQFWEQLEDALRSNTPVIAGVTQQYTQQFIHAKAVALKIKEINPKITVIAGGADISTRYEHILGANDCFDMLVRGEGELAFKQIIEWKHGNRELSTIKGIAYKKDNKIITQPPEPVNNLDQLPLPAYQLVDMEKYFTFNKDNPTRTRWLYPGSERGVTLITSRGCPYACNFCSIHLHMGRKWRSHSAGYITRHMAFLIEKYGVRYFHFEDDNFTLDKTRFSQILDSIIENKWDITWDSPNGIRIDSLNRELLRKMRKSGVTFANVGIESGVQRVLDDIIHKKLDLKKVKEIARMAHEEKVHLKGFYIIGFPGETKEDIKNTVDFALTMAVKYNFPGGIAFAVPLLGTELYRVCEENKYFTTGITEDAIAAGYTRKGLIKTAQFGPDFLKEMLQYYSKHGKGIKLKLIIKNILSDFRLLAYLVKRLRENSSLWRHYLSEIAYWNFLLIKDNKVKGEVNAK